MCGNKLDDNAEVCTNCGCNPLAGKSYCQNCGAKTIEQQELCTQCGVRLEFAASGKNNQTNTGKAISGLSIGLIIVMIVVAIAFPPLFIVWLIIGGIISIYDKNKKKGQINSKK